MKIDLVNQGTQSYFGYISILALRLVLMKAFNFIVLSTS